MLLLRDLRWPLRRTWDIKRIYIHAYRYIIENNMTRYPHDETISF